MQPMLGDFAGKREGKAPCLPETSLSEPKKFSPRRREEWGKLLRKEHWGLPPPPSLPPRLRKPSVQMLPAHSFSVLLTEFRPAHSERDKIPKISPALL